MTCDDRADDRPHTIPTRLVTAEGEMPTDLARRVLALGQPDTLVPTHGLVERLEDDADGDAYRAALLGAPLLADVVAMFRGGPIVALDRLERLKDDAKRLLDGSLDANGGAAATVAGAVRLEDVSTVGYLFAIAGALWAHETLITSVPRGDLHVAMLDLASVMPEEMGDPVADVAMVLLSDDD